MCIGMPYFEQIKTLFITGWLIVCFQPAIAQPHLAFEHLTTQDGLPDVRIESIYQDRRGFLWFGTPTGLCRYDGTRLKTYRQDPNMSASQSPKSGWQMVEDTLGNMWVGAYHQLHRYDAEQDTFATFVTDTNVFALKPITSLYADRRGNLWVGSATQGLLRFDVSTKKSLPFSREFGQDIKPQTVRSILEDSFGNLWFSYPNGLWRFAWKDSSLRYFPLREDHERALQDGFIHALYEDRRKNLWVGTKNGLLHYDREYDRFVAYPLDGGTSAPSPAIYAICEAGDGSLWMGAPNRGVYILNPRSGLVAHYAANEADPLALQSNSIRTIYRDQQGDMWIGTLLTGVSHWSRNHKAFSSYTRDLTILRRIIQGKATGFHEMETGKIWVATDDHTELFAPVQQAFFKDWNMERAFQVARDPEGWLWVASWLGLNKIDASGKKMVEYRPDPTRPGSLPGRAVPTVLSDRQGTIWAGVWGKGLFRYDSSRDAFDPHPLTHPQVGVAIGLTINCMYEDQRNNLWIGGGNSLIKLGPDRRLDTFYMIPRCMMIHEDSQGMFWLGTIEGLYRLNPKNGNYTFWSEKEGLPHNHVSSILEDDRGNLWLGTNRGLSCFDPRSETFRNYDVSDGLPGDIFWPRASLKTPSGEFYFGLPEGVLRFHPDSIRDNPHIPPVVITHFQISNRPVPIRGSLADTLELPSPLEQQIPYAKEIRLRWWQNDISFEFAALNYFHPEKNQYKYRLENYDQDWIATDARRRSATYTNLAPGSYTFRVLGSNNDGVWNEAGASLTILISPPWWKTWWAYTLYGLFFLSGLWALRRYEIKRQRLRHALEMEQVKAEKLEEVNALKSRFFMHISHEFRTPLTLILGPVEELIKHRPHSDRPVLELIQRNSQRLLNLINQLLDLSKLEAGGMQIQASRHDLIPFLRQIFAFFSTTAETKKLRYTFHSDTGSVFGYFDWEKLEKIMINLLSNAFKFTPEGGTVSLTLKSAEDPVELIVADSGPGISAEHLPHIFDRFYQVDGVDTRAQEGTGIGLALVQELVRLHHGTIDVDSTPGAGTRFIVRLPIGKAHLQASEIAEEVPPQALNISMVGSLLQTQTWALPTVEAQEELPQLLIVEDNFDMRSYIRQSLEPHFRIVEAANGRLGLDFALEQVPDLILSDVMMPEMDGLELCRQVKADPRTSHIPVILLTAKADVENRIEGLTRGADVYLAKPFHREELLIHVQNLIELRRQLHARYRDPDALAPTEDPDIQMEDAFIRQLTGLIETHLSDETFRVPQICRAIGMSQAQVYRKIKALTGQSAGNFVRSIRLRKALHLLRTSSLNVSEVAYEVGFSDPAYFSRTFKEEFGMSPSEAR